MPILLLAALLCMSTIYAAKTEEGTDITAAEIQNMTKDTLAISVRRTLTIREIIKCIRRFLRIAARAARADTETARKICGILVRSADAIEDLSTTDTKRLTKLLILLLIKILRWLDCLLRDVIDIVPVQP